MKKLHSIVDHLSLNLLGKGLPTPQSTARGDLCCPSAACYACPLKTRGPNCFFDASNALARSAERLASVRPAHTTSYFQVNLANEG